MANGNFFRETDYVVHIHTKTLLSVDFFSHTCLLCVYYQRMKSWAISTQDSVVVYTA